MPEKLQEKKTDDHGEQPGNGNLSNWVLGIFESFKTARQPFEEMWIECWYNYLAKYQQETAWRKQTEGQEGNSRIFIKLTTLKCNTAHAKIMDMAFPTSGGEEVPFDIIPIRTEVHAGVDDEQLKKIAENLKQRLRDHHKEIELIENIDNGVLELAIMGTAVIKGPIIDYRRVKRFNPRTIFGLPVSHFDPSINPFEIQHEDMPLPVFKHIPLWSYYCDPNAENNRKSIGEIHFDRMLPSEFLGLKSVGGYRADMIDAVKEKCAVVDESTEDFKYVQLADNYTGKSGEKDKKISVLEYWGLVKAGDLRAEKEEVPEEIGDEDLVEALICIAGSGEVIKAKMNPMGRRVFNVCPYKKIPHCIFGHGVAWAMRDSQKMVNSSYRMIIDNKAIFGPGMLAVNLDRINTKRTKDLKIYPKKVWYVKGNFAPKDVIDNIKFQDASRDLRELAMDFDRFADEETGIPKFETGDQASFLNKTASGMSMLMRRTDVNIRPAIKNIDDYWIEPIVEAEADWFVEMDPDPNIKVPFKIKATGTSTLISNEIKMENMAKFMQITGANPADAIFVDRPKAMREWARMLDTQDIMRTEDEIKQIMAEMDQRANEPKDLREYVQFDKLFPLLTSSEQCQILTQLGITPDQNGRAVIANTDLQLKQAEINEKNAKAKAPATAPAQSATQSPPAPASATTPNQAASPAQMTFNLGTHPQNQKKKITLKKNPAGHYEAHVEPAAEEITGGNAQ